MALVVNLVALSVSHLPGWEPFRDAGAGMFAALLLWLAAVAQLGRASPPCGPAAAYPGPVPLLAA